MERLARVRALSRCAPQFDESLVGEATLWLSARSRAVGIPAPVDF